jgi:hypothetical protein
VANLSLFTWIGNAAAQLGGRHGAVAHQADAVGCSRQTVYDHALKVQQAVRDAQLPGPSREQLLHDRERLRDEIRQLGDWLEQTIDGPAAKLQQFAVTASAMGLSLTQTLTLLAVLVPPARCPSRAVLGRWVRDAGQRAGRVLAALDQACRSVVVCLGRLVTLCALPS